MRRDNWAGKILADKLKYENSILQKVFQSHTEKTMSGQDSKRGP